MEELALGTVQTNQQLSRSMRILLSSIILISTTIAMSSCSQQKTPLPKKNVQHVSGADEVTYIKLGNEISDSVQLLLKQNLVSAMQDGGPIAAVEFCNTKALPLTNTYSEKYFTEVKRVSDKNRNPKNAASEKELAIMEDFRNTLKDSKPLSPKVTIDAEGKKHYYAPIYMGGVCLTCHGNPKNMQPELVSTLDSLYPKDKARGYAVDELRGLWSVKFKNS